MISLVTAVLFVGYTLVYAAVANGGKLALHPWDALRVDAYTGESASAASSSSSGGGGKSTFDRIIGIAGGAIDLLPVIGLP